MLMVCVRRIQGIVQEIIRTDEFKEDEDGNKWYKCIFIVKLDRFSKRTPNEELPARLKNEKVRIVRWCCFDWHYKTGIRITLTPNETKAVLEGRLDLTR